jgi:hypothetical protein
LRVVIREFPLGRKQCKVSIVKERDVVAGVSQALSLIGGIERLVTSRSRVLIKPNLSVPLSAKTGVTTEPNVVIALIHLAKEAGAREVVVGESMEISIPAQQDKNLTIVEGKGCSGCSVTNRMALSFFSRQEIEALGSVTLLVGDMEGLDYSLTGRPFFVGNCAIRSSHGKKGARIGGCPPPGLWIRQGLTNQV